MQSLKRFLFTLLAMALLLPPSAFALQKGDTPPTLTGRILDGGDFDLRESKGRPIILKVGTTWCPSCGQQTEEIGKIRDFIDRHDIEYIEIFVQEREKTVRSFINRSGHHKPDQVVLDQGRIARALNIYAIPRLILIDGDYRVFRDGDPLSSGQLQQQLEKMLTKK